MKQLARTVCLAAVAGSCLSAADVRAQAYSEARRGDDELEQLIVFGARVPLPVEHNGSAVTVLTAAQLERDGRASVGEILRSTPGVAMSRAGGPGALSQLRMRGGEANHVAVFLDGVKVNDASQSGEFDFAHLLNSDIERIEIVRGPQSALWGSDALSGVVNVVSRRPAAGLRSDAKFEAGSDGWQKLAGGFGAGGERSHVRLSATRLATDGYNVSRVGDERDGYENTSVNLRAGFALSNAVDLDLRLHRIESASDFDGTDFGTGLPTDRLNTTDKDQMLAAMRLSVASFEGRLQHDLKFDRFDSENLTTSESGFAPGDFDETRAHAIVDSFVYQAQFALNDAHRLIGALESREEQFIQRGPVDFGDPNRDESLKANSVVIEYDGQLSARLSLLASWRHDANSDFADASTGRVSIAYLLDNDATRLRAAWGEGIKNPTFTERYGFFTDFLGNPTLTPERSHSAEFGIDHSFAMRGLRLSATFFEETLRNEIDGFVFDPVSGAFTSANQPGESRRRGLEFEGVWDAGAAFDIDFSLTWLDAEEYAGTDVVRTREIRRPQRTAGFGLRWAPLQRQFDLALDVDHSSAQDDFFFPPAPPFQERVTLDDFTLVTLSAAWSLTAAWRFDARIENLLDEEYEEVFGFRGSARRAFVGLRYAFGD